MDLFAPSAEFSTGRTDYGAKFFEKLAPALKLSANATVLDLACGSGEIAVAADVKDRTARAYASAMAEMEVFEVSKTFGGYRYRLSAKPSSAALKFIARLDAAKQILG